MGMDIANCPVCGKIFVKGIRDICPNCVKKQEEQYERCAEYLRQHKGITLYELSEAVDVPVRQITKFIREGRISIENAPNMSYPCEVCGEMIRENSMCESCRSRLIRDMAQALEEKGKTPPHPAVSRLSTKSAIVLKTAASPVFN
ncbi:flagellar protein [Paenibacillus larvae]|nr:flagellar protein [Paenibacillus larvae]